MELVPRYVASANGPCTIGRRGLNAVVKCGTNSRTGDFMEDAVQPYGAVYHFRDNYLLQTFLAAIPRPQLLEPLRSQESLRNRYFPGFRLSNSVPSGKQLATAYQKEIVGQHNGKLASDLCASWIQQKQAVTIAGLQALGVQPANPADAYSWIGDVHARIKSSGSDETFRALVRNLSAHFPSDEIRIFVSIISYCKEQDAIQKVVTDELGKVADPPEKLKGIVLGRLNAAKERIKELRKLEGDLQQQLQSEVAKAQADLDDTLRAHDDLSKQLSDDDSLIADLTKQLAQLKSEILERQQTQDATKKRQRTLGTSIGRQRRKLAAMQLSFDKRVKQISKECDEQEAEVRQFTSDLQGIEAQILASSASNVHLETIQAEASAPVEVLPPSTSPVPVEPSKRAVEALGNNAICYQGIQRTFRNAVVSFLRERLDRLFPGDHIQRLTKTFGQDWEKAAREAVQSRAMLGTTTVVRDEYDLLGTNHFYGLFERFYDKIFSPDAGQPPNLPRPVKARFLGNLKAIKDGRDPLSHPVEEEISFEEAHHLLYMAQEILKWIGYNNQASTLSGLAAQLGATKQDPALPPLLRRLPSEDSIYFEFVGRNTLLKQLADCFANPDNKRCLLAGDGGKGKSAVAYKFVQGMPSCLARFQLIVWLSAKKRKFREGATTVVESPDFTTATDAIDRLLTEYGATAQDMVQAASKKKHLLFEFLNEFPAFIIADDIDSVLDDDDVVSLFTHEIPHTQSSVLLTSRRAIPGVRNFIVKGFEPLEAEEFIKSRIRIYGLETSTFSAGVIKDIAKVTDGSPLYMDDLMRLAKIVDIHKAITIWAEKGGDEARKYALQREIEKLSSDSRKILIAAAVTDDPISFAELQSVLELPDERLLPALTELQTLFLFPKAPAVEGEQRYEINLNTKKLVRLVEGTNGFYARIENRSKALAGKLPVVGHSIVASLIRQAFLRLNAEQSGEAETILLGAIEKYPNAPDLRGVLGLVYRRMHRVSDARAQFEAAFRFKPKAPDMYLHWMKMEISEKEWSRALSVADRALKTLPDAVTYEIAERKAYILRQAGFDLYRGMHYEKAAKMWSEAVEEVKRRIKPPEALPTGARSLNASMFYTIVVCLDMLNQLRDRNYWLERWEKEHADDPQVAVQKEFLMRKRGSLSASVR